MAISNLERRKAFRLWNFLESSGYVIDEILLNETSLVLVMNQEIVKWEWHEVNNKFGFFMMNQLVTNTLIIYPGFRTYQLKNKNFVFYQTFGLN